MQCIIHTECRISNIYESLRWLCLLHTMEIEYMGIMNKHYIYVLYVKHIHICFTYMVIYQISANTGDWPNQIYFFMYVIKHYIENIKRMWGYSLNSQKFIIQHLLQYKPLWLYYYIVLKFKVYLHLLAWSDLYSVTRMSILYV